MALEVVYEGMISGTKNAAAAELASANAVMEAGRIAALSSASGTNDDANTVYVGIAGGDTIVATADKPFGLVADYKDDVISNGKISVYFSQGLYRTDQIKSGVTFTKGDLVSFDTDGKLKIAAATEYIVGICTEVAGADGFMELFLNITGETVPV